MLQEGFIYRWTNSQNNKMYIGSHVGCIDDGYTGSGKYFKHAYEKNSNHFTRQILYKIESENIQYDLQEIEETLLTKLNVADSSEYYNITNKAFGGDNYSGLSENDKQAFRKKCKDNWKPPKNYESWYNNVNMAKLKECYQFDKDGKLLRMFDSLDIACKEFGVNTKGNLSTAYKGNRNTWQGYRWSYTNKPNLLNQIKKTGRKKGTSDTKIRKKRKTVTGTSYEVHYINENNDIIETFLSPEHCAKDHNISKQMLVHYLNGRCGKKYKGKMYIKGKKITFTKNNY